MRHALLPRVQATAVEVYDWIDTSHLTGLVANFARVHVLFSLFDGDPAKWLRMIEADGTRAERENDVPFLRDLQQRMEHDPAFAHKLRHAVTDFAHLMLAAEAARA